MISGVMTPSVSATGVDAVTFLLSPGDFGDGDVGGLRSA